MVRRRKRRVYVPPEPAKPPVPAALKAAVAARARELIESVLRPLHVKPPPDEQLNYLIDIGTTWYRGYFSVLGTDRSPGPTALAPTFEARFSRPEDAGAGRSHLAFLRHTGQWVELYRDLPPEHCLEAIRDDPFSLP